VTAADALGLVRLLAAVMLPAALLGQPGSWRPFWLFAVAALSDWLDGRVARRRGPTRHGAVLDNVADIAFVLAGTLTGAFLGRVPRAVPAAIAVAFAVYAVVSLRASVGHGSWRLARSRTGHAAGVLNYAVTGLLTGATALPGPVWTPILGVGSAVVIAVNVAAVLERAVPPLVMQARALRVGESRARSPRS